MDSHVALAELATRPHAGLTAFSALPGAPVLPVVERRRPVARMLRRAAAVFPGPRRRRVAVRVPAQPACS